jgi:hypothetical protein
MTRHGTSVRMSSRPVRLAYQPPVSSSFLSEQISRQQPANNTFLSEQISTSHQPPVKRTRSQFLCCNLSYCLLVLIIYTYSSLEAGAQQRYIGQDSIRPADCRTLPTGRRDQIERRIMCLWPWLHSISWALLGSSPSFDRCDKTSRKHGLPSLIWLALEIASCCCVHRTAVYSAGRKVIIFSRLLVNQENTFNLFAKKEENTFHLISKY